MILDLSHFDATDLFIVILDILVLIIPAHFAITGGGKRYSFPFVSPDTQQLFPNGVFGRKTVLDVRFKERLIANAALDEVATVVPVQVLQCFGGDDVETPLALVCD